MNTSTAQRSALGNITCIVKHHLASPGPRRYELWLTVCFALMMAGAGCRVTAPSQLVAGHAKEDIAVNPQQIRLRMRALVEPLSGAIVDSADRISAGTTNRAVQREALVWKLEAVPALREALFRPNPFSAIMDSWVLTLQMTDYFESGPGREALGEAAPIAVTTCQYPENQIESVAKSFTHSGDLSRTKEFIRDWAKAHPIRLSIASRESTLSRVTELKLRETFSTQEIVGNVAVSLDDLSRRLDVYSVQLLDQARWQAELFAMDQAAQYELERAMPLAETAVQSATEAVDVVKQLAPAVQDALEVAEAAPELVSRERAAAIEAVRDEISRTIEFVQAERIAALEHLTKEREAVLLDLRQTIIAEREVLAADLEQASRNVVDHTILRTAQLAAGILVAVFVGIIMLLFIARRVFVEHSRATAK